jgi:Glycosyl transferase family 11
MKLNNRICLILHGELGNQMFQMATALSLARRKGFELEAACRNNPYRLQQFRIPSHVQIVEFENSQMISQTKILKFQLYKYIIRGLAVLRRKIEKTTSHDLIGNVYSENIPHYYDISLLDVKAPLTLNGYFQSWKYFREDAEFIKGIYNPEQISNSTLQILEDLPKSFTAIHVRRGNSGASLLNYEFHGLLPADYYLNAIKMLSKLNKLYPIVMFTDNLNECKKLIEEMNHELPLLKIISPEDVVNQVENLWLMTKASSFVGANSSYSWWAAYLNCKEDTEIIFPRPWYKHPGQSVQNLLPPKWCTVGFEDFLSSEGRI